MTPIYVPGKVVFAQTYIGIDDPDAATYIAAVEAADGQSLETAVKVAIHGFVKGCKADGIWPAIKASCILAGARTLSGCLVPLVGTAPTNFNFVAGDYNRKTGLKGNRSTKYLNANRLSSADPQNSFHSCVHVTASDSSNATFYVFLGEGTATTGATHLALNAVRCRASTAATGLASTSQGFIGSNRSGSSVFNYRHGGDIGTFSTASETPAGQSHFVFARNVSGSMNSPTDARLAFYSIGESLNLALLDARVTALINAIAAAIP